MYRNCKLCLICEKPIVAKGYQDFFLKSKFNYGKTPNRTRFQLTFEFFAGNMLLSMYVIRFNKQSNSECCVCFCAIYLKIRRTKQTYYPISADRNCDYLMGQFMCTKTEL